jgi:hypothetical protein
MIKEEKVSFDKINEEYIIIINNNWYKYEIICSYSPKFNKLLISNDMILIPKTLKSNILKDVKFNKFNKKILHTTLESKKSKYIELICENVDEYIIYYGLTKIIKT